MYLKGDFQLNRRAFRKSRLAAVASLVLSVSFLALNSARAAEEQKAVVPKDAPLPAAREVIAKFVNLVGSKEDFDKIQSQRAVGKVEMTGQGISGKLEVLARRPDKLVIKINLPGIGDLLEGYDGKVGWSVNPLTGPMLLEGKMLEHVQEEARFDSVMHDEGDFKSMETVGRVEFEGKSCYQLKLVRKSGQELTEYYEIDTGLMRGTTGIQETPLGSINVTGVAENYKKYGPILLATKMIQKMGPLSQTMIFESVEFNTVQDSAFDLPDEIKALTKK